MPPSLYRGPLPTLTEDDVREAGERATLPPPVPMSDLVAGMMVGDEVPDVELRELGPDEAAHVIVEISEAYLAELGTGAGVPVLLKTAAQVAHLPLDHLTGFLMSMIDGHTTVEDIVDVSSLPRVESLRLLCELRELGLIDVRRRR
jgi:hypothetical protein